MNYDEDHYNTGDGYPQNRGDVRHLSQGGRHEFMAECDAEPADFENCLACYAYGVEQGLSDEEMFQVQADRRERDAAPAPLSPYRLVLTERNKAADEITELPFDSPLRSSRFAFLDGLDHALNVIVREYGTD